MFQVMAFSAILGCENRGKHSTPLYHRRRHRKQTTKDLASSGVVAVTPHTAVTARRIFSIPRALLPSSQSHISVPHPLRQHGDIISPEIYVSYVVKVCLVFVCLVIPNLADNSEFFWQITKVTVCS